MKIQFDDEIPFGDVSEVMEAIRGIGYTVDIKADGSLECSKGKPKKPKPRKPKKLRPRKPKPAPVEGPEEEGPEDEGVDEEGEVKEEETEVEDLPPTVEFKDGGISDDKVDKMQAIDDKIKGIQGEQEEALTEAKSTSSSYIEMQRKKESGKLKGQRLQCLKLLEDGETVKLNDIAVKTGIGRGSACTALYWLTNAGLTVKPATGAYKITPKGKDTLDNIREAE